MRVVISKKAEKNLDKFPKYVREEILWIAALLEEFPRLRVDIKKIGAGVYRIRKGKYRLLFAVQEDIIIIFEINVRGRISYAKG